MEGIPFIDEEILDKNLDQIDTLHELYRFRSNWLHELGLALVQRRALLELLETKPQVFDIPPISFDDELQQLYREAVRKLQKEEPYLLNEYFLKDFINMILLSQKCTFSRMNLYSKKLT